MKAGGLQAGELRKLKVVETKKQGRTRAALPCSAASICLLLTALLSPPAALAEVVLALHRGGRFVYPENSILNFEVSVTGGAQWLETDAWLSKDGVPVIFHDLDLCRTTNIEDDPLYFCEAGEEHLNPLGRKPRVQDFDLAALQQLEIGVYLDTDGNSYNFPNTRMPTVEEALLATAGSGVPLLIEVKKPGMAVLFKDIVDRNEEITADDLIVWARQAFAFQEYHDDFPEVRVITGAFFTDELVVADEQLLKDRAAAGDFAIAVQATKAVGERDLFDADLVRRIHEHGLRVYAIPAGTGNISIPDQIRAGADYVHDYRLSEALARLAANPCMDGLDQDGDGLYDTNGIDFDYDGINDAGPDPQCIDRDWGSEESQCNDGVDNDLDGATDHPADTDCSSPEDPGETVECADGADNDLDGLVDFPDDPDCDSAEDAQEGVRPPLPLALPEPSGLARVALLTLLAIGSLARRGRRCAG